MRSTTVRALGALLIATFLPFGALLPATFLPAPAGAAVESPVRTGDVSFAQGVNTHFSFQGTVYDTSYPTVRDRLFALGVHHIRDSPIDGGTYGPVLQARYREMGAGGVYLHLILSTPTQPWSVDAIDGSAIPRPVTELEPVNEADVSCDVGNGIRCAFWPADLRTFVIAALATANGDPYTSDLPMFAPAFADSRDGPAAYRTAFTSDRPWDYVLRGGTGNGHLYSGGAGVWPESLGNAGWGIDLPTANAALTTNVSNRAVNAITEDGWRYDPGVSGQSGVTEACGGKYGLRKFMHWVNQFHQGLSVPEYYWYQLVEVADNEDYGMLRQDLTQRPIFNSIANFNALIDDGDRTFTPTDWDFTISTGATTLHHQLMQDGRGYNWLALWKGVQSCADNKTNVAVGNATVTVTFNTTPRPAQAWVYRPSGGTAATKTAHNAAGIGSVTVNVPDEVVLLKWHR